nr:MAG TPA: hypothetical protein [Bacteriophage sp.]
MQIQNFVVFRWLLHEHSMCNSNFTINKQQKTLDIANIPRVLSSE